MKKIILLTLFFICSGCTHNSIENTKTTNLYMPGEEEIISGYIDKSIIQTTGNIYTISGFHIIIDADKNTDEQNPFECTGNVIGLTQGYGELDEFIKLYFHIPGQTIDDIVSKYNTDGIFGGITYIGSGERYIGKDDIRIDTVRYAYTDPSNNTKIPYILQIISKVGQSYYYITHQTTSGFGIHNTKYFQD